MTDKLKPCPFCGGEARITDVFGRTGIVCKDCFAEMRGYLDMTPEEMTRYWNTRKPMDRIVRQLIEEVKGYGQGLDLVDEAPYESYVRGKIMAYEEAIEIVKGGAE